MLVEVRFTGKCWTRKGSSVWQKAGLAAHSSGIAWAYGQVAGSPRATSLLLRVPARWKSVVFPSGVTLTLKAGQR